MNRLRNNEYVADQGDLNFTEIIWRLLEQWKVILIFSILISLLFSGIQYYRHSKTSHNLDRTDLSNAMDEETIISNLSEVDRDLVSSLVSIYRTRKKVMEALSDDAYMQLDARHIKSVHITASIINADEQDVGMIADAYVSGSQSDTIVKAISDALNDSLNVESIRRLVSASTSGKPGSGIFDYTIYLPENADSNAVIESLKKGFQTLNNNIEEQIGAHKLVFLSEEERFLSDFNVTRIQADTYSYINNMTNQITSLLTSCSDSQKSAYLSIVSLDEGNMINEANGNYSFFNKRNIFIGLIFGVVLYVMIILYG